MNVESVMVRDVRTCRPQDDLTVAVREMWEGDLGCVPVVDEEGHVVGMLTDRDACMAAYTRGRPLHELHVRDSMSSRVHACRTADELTAAERLMRTHQVRRLPVLDDAGRLVGLLSLNDLALAAADRRTRREKGLGAEDVAAVLADVSAHRVPLERDEVLVPARATKPEHVLSS